MPACGQILDYVYALVYALEVHDVGQGVHHTAHGAETDGSIGRRGVVAAKGIDIHVVVAAHGEAAQRYAGAVALLPHTGAGFEESRPVFHHVSVSGRSFISIGHSPFHLCTGGGDVVHIAALHRYAVGYFLQHDVVYILVLAPARGIYHQIPVHLRKVVEADNYRGVASHRFGCEVVYRIDVHGGDDAVVYALHVAQHHIVAVAGLPQVETYLQLVQWLVHFGQHQVALRDAAHSVACALCHHCGIQPQIARGHASGAPAGTAVSFVERRGLEVFAIGQCNVVARHGGSPHAAQGVAAAYAGYLHLVSYARLQACEVVAATAHGTVGHRPGGSPHRVESTCIGGGAVPVPGYIDIVGPHFVHYHHGPLAGGQGASAGVEAYAVLTVGGLTRRRGGGIDGP